ncbi:dTDP-glucose 4,6-dehydratase [Variovorax soli]|uniref:dTDP-glucose 4,6-dehydratase n=2 Tax=Variovorax soli TaxID=376815 RepID=A0ABU1NBZ8_9BURK|nr:dTDP-glucose 4,6-dehydratase [Variovorax soli]
MRKQSLFITGGTGFVGKWLLECLLHAERTLRLGIAVTVLTRDPDAFGRASPHLAHAPAVTLIRGDVQDFAAPAGEFSCVIHAALPVAPQQAGGSALQALAEAGARRVCEFAASCRAGRLLHISSGAVYGGQQSAESLTEEMAWNASEAANDYTRAKRLAEAVMLQHWPFDVVIARCFAFIGPYLLPSSGAAAAQFIEEAAAGQGIIVQGTGDAVRSYQYAADMARWLLSCLVLGAPRRAYNIGSDRTVTIAALAAQITRLSGTGVPLRIAGQPKPGLAGQRYVPSVQRARAELGLTNAVDLEEGIQRTLAWRRQAPAATSTAST